MKDLVLTLGGREICRTLIKKESMGGSCSKENADASDNDGDCSFSGSSKTFNPEKMVREKKSWLNYELIGKEVSKPKHKNSSVQKCRSNKVKITVDKEKVEWLKDSRDYSFLLSDNDKSVINPNPWMVKNVSKSRASMAKKKLEESRKAKVTSKPPVLSSKPCCKESGFKNSGRSNLEGHVRKRKQVIYDSEEDDDDVDDINVDPDIQKEETRSAKIARKEDVQERKRS
ncbi:Hypothetical predicted protein [Olea europaea subsp. europaea]|uniref:Uncharacterized protein n=1 Tax=Olea europaea subsp. europaea TaxID=158383 RepID=A0A8S0PK05_OLEEU|nr:Hypothetical predicted protein [Olea europaea subsp. europaea]